MPEVRAVIAKPFIKYLGQITLLAAFFADGTNRSSVFVFRGKRSPRIADEASVKKVTDVSGAPWCNKCHKVVASVDTGIIV